MPLPSRLSACLCALLLLRFISSSSAAVTSNTLFAADVAAQLDHDIEALIKQNNLPGVAVGIFIPGKGHYTFVEGSADLQTHTSRTLDQPFRIASVTKPFAATAILVLVDRGLLHKTDTIARWYPHFPNADKITIDDLLRMRSGIPAPNDDEVLARVYDAPLAPAPALAAELKSLTQQEQMQGKPLVGTDADYGEGVAFGHGFCGHSGTVSGYSTDMYYVEKLDLSFVISVNRLDRDNKSQSQPILGLVSKTILSALDLNLKTGTPQK